MNPLGIIGAAMQGGGAQYVKDIESQETAALEKEKQDAIAKREETLVRLQQEYANKRTDKEIAARSVENIADRMAKVSESKADRMAKVSESKADRESAEKIVSIKGSGEKTTKEETGKAVEYYYKPENQQVRDQYPNVADFIKVWTTGEYTEPKDEPKDDPNAKFAEWRRKNNKSSGVVASW